MKMTRTVIISLLVVSIYVLNVGAIPTEEWNKTFGGNFYSVNQTSDGGYISAGVIANDGWLIKTNQYGNKQWSKIFNVNGNIDIFYSVQQTKDGGYIIAGTTFVSNKGNEAWVVKTDSLGNKIWSRIFGGIGNDDIYSVQQTNDEGYILAGRLNNDAWLVKLNVLGNQQWNKTFGGTNWDEGRSVQQTKDGGYVIAGSTQSYGAGNRDVWLIKTDVYGNKLWSKTFGGTNRDEGRSVQQTKDGGYIIAGDTSSFAIGDEDPRDAWAIKTDISGNKLWSKVFDNTDDATSVYQTKDGGYVVSTNTEAPYEAWAYFWYEIIKIDNSGNVQWGIQHLGDWDGLDRIRLESVRQAKDGGYILAGYKGWSGYGDGTSFLRKLSADTSSSITVVSPNGGENWARGTTKTITWTSSGSPGAYVKIELLKAGVLNRVITSSTPNDGSHSWLINSAQTLGSDYKIRITSTTNAAYTDTSNANFIISPSTPSIIVFSPNGGENWVRGTTKTITWTSSGSPGAYVKIELLKAGVLNRIISSSTANDGSYSWLIPSTQTLGTNYKVRITSTSNTKYNDTSNNNFTISAPVNLLKNPGFETASGTVPQYWNKSQTGIKAVFTYPEIGRLETGKSVAIKYATKETGKVALWQQSGIIVAPSKQYKLSGYMKLENVTGGGTGRLNGASLRINWYASTGTLIRVDLITRSGTKAWTKYENTFTSPSNAVKVNVGGDLFNSSGKVWFDDISFMKIS